jgi:hypothetical protein
MPTGNVRPAAVQSEGMVPVRMCKCLCCFERTIRSAFLRGYPYKTLLSVEQLCKCAVPENTIRQWAAHEVGTEG